MSVNKVMLLGNVGQDPEVKETPNGTKVANFSLATEEVWYKDAKKESRTEWHNIVAWGKTAELADDFIRKGDKLYLEGKCSTSSWDKDGQTHYRTNVVADKFEFIAMANKADEVAPGANER